MTTRHERMLQAFAEFAENDPAVHLHSVVGVQPGTRLYRIIRLPYGWRLWLATRDFIYGSYLEMHDTGEIMRYETRADEGEEIIRVRPSDEEIRNAHAKDET